MMYSEKNVLFVCANLGHSYISCASITKLTTTTATTTTTTYILCNSILQIKNNIQCLINITMNN